MTDPSTTPSTGSAAVDRVHAAFARIRAGDLSVADLFNDEAELRFGHRTWRGRAAIREFYSLNFANNPQPEVLATLTDGSLVAAVLNVRTADGRSVSAVDVFELDDKGIVAMTVYTSGS